MCVCARVSAHTSCNDHFSSPLKKCMEPPFFARYELPSFMANSRHFLDARHTAAAVESRHGFFWGKKPYENRRKMLISRRNTGISWDL